MNQKMLKKISLMIGYFVLTAASLQVSAATLTMIDPATGRTVYVDTPVDIAGCDAGLVMYKGWYVCKDKLPPPPPPPPPPPAPIYPPADAVCRGDYPVETDGVGELRCASGYIRRNRSHQDNAWCEMTAAQKELCTVIYPPAPPTPRDPTSGPGWQGGYLGSDGNMYSDPKGESLCSSCDRVIGHVNGGDDSATTPETPQPDPNDSSTDGSENNSGSIGGGE